MDELNVEAFRAMGVTVKRFEKAMKDFSIRVSEVMEGLTIELDISERNMGSKHFRCYRCKEEKGLDRFYVDSSRNNGRRGYCKTCDNEIRTERYKQMKIAKRKKPLSERFKTDDENRKFYPSK